MSNTRKVKKLITTIKKKKPTSEEIKSFASTFIELMVESGIHPQTRREFYQYSQNPSINLDKLIDIAEDTIGAIEEKI